MAEFLVFARDLDLPISNPNYALYLDCIYKRQGWIENGKIKYSDVKAIVSQGVGKSAASEIVDACSDLPLGSNDSKTLLEFGKCLAKQVKDNKVYYRMWRGYRN